MNHEWHWAKESEIICSQDLKTSYSIEQRAVDFNCNSSEGHKWYAIVVGSRSEYVGTKEKIEDGYEFKRHIDRAAELAPHDHTIQHLLGRYEDRPRQR